MLTSSVTLALVAAALLGWYFFNSQQKSSKLPLPPGPRKLPIIGNLHQAPKLWPWRTYRDWTKTYGPIFTLQYGRDTIIMLGSHNTARDLLDKRSNIYSSRPHLVMGQDCVSKGNRSLLMPYGPQYRLHQRIQGGLLHPRFAQQYVKLQDLESRQLMSELLTASEDDWMGRFHRYSSSLIFGLAYGKRMPRGDEEEVQNIGQVMENILYSARVGTWIVDAIPVLNKLPTFLAPWKQTADKYHDFESAFFMRNLEEAQKSTKWNWAKQAKTMKESREMTTKELSYLVGIMYEAGSDTTTQALHSFVLAALTYPDVYKEVQKQLDDVVGDRFPTFEDRQQLACVEAAAKETLRWRPVSSGGIPHALTQDDEYMGYHILKGATVISNHWACDLDAGVYGTDVLDFRPSRWLENPDLPLASFGYGRRICTGQHLAMNSLFINIARVLWAFNIEHATDSSGQRIEVDSLAYTQGFNSGPLPFKARFVARSPEKRAVVEKMWEGAEKDVGVLLDEIQQATSKGS